MKKDTKRQYRLYQLHRHLKKITKVSVKTRHIYISERKYIELTEQQKNWIKEIRDNYHYAIQTEIE